MKILRIVMSIVFVITTILYAYFLTAEKTNTDTSIPKITIEDELIEVSIKATDEELLAGVTAYDEKDKDITHKVIVESISAFVEPGYCRITYAVCDSDNNVASATRKLRYTDYTSPRFHMKDDLCFSLYERMNISEILSAVDCIQGDISSEMVITSQDYTGSLAGVYDIDVSVTNAKGDTVELQLPLVIEDSQVSAPDIHLKDYLIYIKVGDTPNFKNYVQEAIAVNGEDLTDSVTVETKIDTSKPGTYNVHYYVTDSNGIKGHTILTVVVEE